jgi:hypothetical protein
MYWLPTHLIKGRKALCHDKASLVKKHHVIVDLVFEVAVNGDVVEAGRQTEVPRP